MSADSFTHLVRSSSIYEVNGFQVYPDTNEIVKESIRKTLKPGTMNLLVYLLDQAPRIVSSDELLNNLWPETVGDDSLVHRQVSLIRRAFGDSAKSSELIETLSKRGYRIVAAVKVPVEREASTHSVVEPTIAVRLFEPIGSADWLVDWCAVFKSDLESVLTGMPRLLVLAEPGPTKSKADFEVRGTVRFHRHQLRLTIFLVRTSDSASVWSGSFDIAQDDPEQQESLGETVAFRVQSEVRFNQRRASAMVIHETVNKEAVKLHLQAENHYRLARLGDVNSWGLYQRSLEKAVELDENFAAAQFDLAEFYALRIGGTPYAEASMKAKHAIVKGLELQPDSALGYQRLGQIQLGLDLDYRAATESFGAALKIDPAAKWCYFGLARIALRRGEVEACRDHLDIACELDVLVGEANFLNAAGGYYAQIGDTDKGLRLLDQALRIAPKGTQRLWLLGVKAGVFAWQSGKVDQQQLCNLLDQMIAITGTDHMPEFAGFLVQAGRVDRAHEIMMNLPSGVLNPAFVALGFFYTGELERGFEYLEQGLKDRVEFVLDGIRIGPCWDIVRNQSRFNEILIQLAQIEDQSSKRHT